MSIRTSKRVMGLAKTVGLVAAMATFGCGSDDGSNRVAGAGGSGNTSGSGGSIGSGGSGGAINGKMAMLRVVHVSPDAPAVDVYIQGQSKPAVENLAYGKSTEYVEVPAGKYIFEIRPAGADAKSDPVYASPWLDLAGGTSYSAVAVGELASTDLSDGFRLLALEDGFKTPAAGDARVRVLHAGADAPSVDIDVGNDGSAEITALSRFEATAAEGTNVQGGEKLQIGIDAGGETVATFTTPPLSSGSNLLLIAAGLLGQKPRETNGFALLAVSDDGTATFIRQNPIVYALHASPDAGNVDVFVGDNEIIDNEAFGDLVRLQVPEGAYTLDFFPGHPGPSLKPTTTPPASVATPTLKAGQEYLVIANGLLTAQPSTFQLSAYQDLFADDTDDTARVRAIHASPNAPAVDVSTVTQGMLNEPPLAQKIAFTHATAPDGAAVPPGSYTLGIAPTGTMYPIARFDLAVSAKERVYAIAAGMLGSNNVPFRLFVIDSSEPKWTLTTVDPK